MKSSNENIASRLSIFMILYYLLNYFIVKIMFHLLNIQKDLLFYSIVFLLTISYLVGAGFTRYFKNYFTRSLYFVLSLWMGILTYLYLFTFIGYALYIIRFLRYDYIAYFIILSTLFLSIYSIFNTFKLNIKQIKISSVKIKSKLKLAHISDLHIGSLITKKNIDKIVENIIKQNPDFVVITGDLFDGIHKYNFEELFSFNKIKVPIYFVMGNHDFFMGKDEIKKHLQNTNIIYLNEKIKYNGINIIGIDDNKNSNLMINTLKEINIKKNEYNLLLYHRPVLFSDVRKNNIDLMLCGHTHAGQIFPFNFVVKLLFKNSKGLFKNEDSYLYVSPGTYLWGPLMRLGSSNEITIIDINPEN